MPLSDTIGAGVVALPHYAPSATVLEELVGDILTPCDYSERKWGFSHGHAQWIGIVSPCGCGATGQRLFCDMCFQVFSRDDNCFTCECGDVTAPARHAFALLEKM